MILEVASSLFFIWLIWWSITTYRERKNMPPGPLPLPVIGNMIQLRFGMFQSLRRLSRKYGDIFTITLPNESAVFITSGKMAREILVMKRDDVAGRIVDAELDRLFEGKDITLQPFGKKLLFRRKVFETALHVYRAPGIGGSAERANTAADTFIQAINHLNGQPFSPEDIVRKCMMASLWAWLTSKECSIDHPIVEKIEEYFVLVIKLSKACFLRNYYPILKYLPSNISKYLKHAQELQDAIFMDEFHDHLVSYSPDVIRDVTDSFISVYQKELKKGCNEDIGSIEDVKGLMMSFLGAGVAAPSTYVVWFILLMVVYPDVQERLHEELDKVVGRKSKPQWKDTVNLHLLQATVQEVIRYSNGLPMINRHVHRDTVISGYKLRKGTRLIVNKMLINNDPRSCTEPELFRPERYLDKDGKYEGLKRFPDFIPFGAGVRQCPGEHLGKLQVIMFTCSMLYYFKWKLADGEAPPTLDSDEFTPLRLPKPYKIVAVDRL